MIGYQFNMAAQVRLFVLRLTDALRNSGALGSRRARQLTRLLSVLLGMFRSEGRGALGVLDHPVPLWRLPRGD